MALGIWFRKARRVRLDLLGCLGVWAEYRVEALLGMQDFAGSWGLGFRGLVLRSSYGVRTGFSF